MPRQKRVVGLAENRFYVLQLLFLRPLDDIANRLGIDVHGIYDACCPHALRGPESEPSRAGADVGDGLALSEAKNLHDAVDLQPVLAARSFKNGQIASVGFAGFSLPFRGSRRLRLTLFINRSDVTGKKQQRDQDRESLSHNNSLLEPWHINNRLRRVSTVSRRRRETETTFRSCRSFDSLPGVA